MSSRLGDIDMPTRDWSGLIWTMVRTDFKARYHRTWFGFVWALAKPLAMLGTLLAVFSLIFAQHADFGLKLVIGLFLWEFFAEGTKVGVTSLYVKGFLLSKARFPSWVIVLTSLSNPLMSLVVYCAGTIGVLVALGRAPDALSLVAFGWYIVHLAVIVTGISLATSALFLRYRDMNQVWEVAIASGFFLTPVVFPLEVIPARFQFWLYAWPPTPVIEFSRSALLRGELPSARAHLMLSAVALTILTVGVLVHRSSAPKIAERV